MSNSIFPAHTRVPGSIQVIISLGGCDPYFPSILPFPPLVGENREHEIGQNVLRIPTYVALLKLNDKFPESQLKTPPQIH